ncbi:MAG: hypothetical protein AAF253_07445 [Pseudomonadota bacterium]
MAKLIVVYRLKQGVTAAAFEAWASGVAPGQHGHVRRLEAFTTHTNGMTEYVEIYHIPQSTAFDASDLPAHVDASIMGEFAGLDGQPQIRVSDEPH